MLGAAAAVVGGAIEQLDKGGAAHLAADSSKRPQPKVSRTSPAGAHTPYHARMATRHPAPTVSTAVTEAAGYIVALASNQTSLHISESLQAPSE